MLCKYTPPSYNITYNTKTGKGTLTPTPTQQPVMIVCSDNGEGNFATTIGTGTQSFIIHKQYTYGDITTQLFLGFFIILFIAYFLIKVFTRQDVYLKR